MPKETLPNPIQPQQNDVNDFARLNSLQGSMGALEGAPAETSSVTKFNPQSLPEEKQPAETEANKPDMTRENRLATLKGKAGRILLSIAVATAMSAGTINFLHYNKEQAKKAAIEKVKNDPEKYRSQGPTKFIIGDEPVSVRDSEFNVDNSAGDTNKKGTIAAGSEFEVPNCYKVYFGPGQDKGTNGYVYAIEGADLSGEFYKGDDLGVGYIATGSNGQYFQTVPSEANSAEQ